MIKALEGFAPEWWTPEGQEQQNPTRFKIRPLDGAEYGEVADHLSVEGTRFFISAKGREVALRYGLEDWENFANSKGPIEFSEENKRYIPTKIRGLIVTRIMKISQLSGDEVKN